MDNQVTKILTTQLLVFVKMFFVCIHADNDTMAHDVWVIYFCKALTLAKTNFHGSNKQ
jgi:hypothetical protein